MRVCQATLVPALALFVVFAAAACSASGSVGQPTLSQSEVEQQAKEALTKEVGQTPKSVNCPGDLDAKVGATAQCTLTAEDGTTLPVRITVTTVDSDGKATFSVKVGEPSPS